MSVFKLKEWYVFILQWLYGVLEKFKLGVDVGGFVREEGMREKKGSRVVV